MAVYTKHGQRITNESARVDESCYFGDKLIKIRAMPESKKKEQIYWVKDLLADGDRQRLNRSSQTSNATVNMAIRTKLGNKVINESLRIDQDCLFRGEIVQVWAILQGQTTEKKYWISDLVGDAKNELQHVLNSNVKKRNGGQ